MCLLVRLVATLGVLVLPQALLTLRYDGSITLVTGPLPTISLRPFGGNVVKARQLLTATVGSHFGSQSGLVPADSAMAGTTSQ